MNSHIQKTDQTFTTNKNNHLLSRMEGGFGCKTKKNVVAIFALLPLTACGGGGGGSPTQTTPPVVPPTPDFTEVSSNNFEARDDNARTLDQGGATANITAKGKAGNDTITTGSGADTIMGAGGNDTITSGGGNDLIRGGEGLDTINSGSGDDVIVVVGTTSAGQYNDDAITNPGGTGIDLSNLITLADLNGRAVSEIESGETIDGGTGNNALYIYGNVDLTGVTLVNVTQLQINSDVTLTQSQLAQFTSVGGDGTSVINIVVPEGSSNVALDLSAVDMNGIDHVNISGDVVLKISSLEDLIGIGAITSSEGSVIRLELISQGDAVSEFSLEEISNVFSSLFSLHVGDHVTLDVDAPEALATLGITVISGEGALNTGGSSEAVEALYQINLEIGTIYALSDNFNTPEDTKIILSIADDILANDSSLAGNDVSLSGINLSGESAENAEIEIDYDLGVVIINPEKNYSGTIELSYNIGDNVGGQTTGFVSVDVDPVDDPATAYGATAYVPIGGNRALSIDGKYIVDGVLITNDAEQLNIEDVDNVLSTTVIKVISISHGTILKNGVVVTEFTYGDVAAGNVIFSHDGTIVQPQLTLAMVNESGDVGQSFDVAVTLFDLNNTTVITQGGTFSSNMVIGGNEGYIIQSANEFFYSNSVSQNLTNYGHITAEASGLGSLRAIAADAIGTVTNYGKIEAKGGLTSTPVYLPSEGTIVNHGLLTSSVSTSTYNDNSYIAFGSVAPIIENTGTIIAKGLVSSGVASNKGMQLNNSGTIYVEGTEEAEGVSAYFYTSNIVNSGLIFASASDEVAESIGVNLVFSTATVENSGHIEADIALLAISEFELINSGTVTGDILGSGSADSVYNDGVMQGDVFLNTGNDVLNNIDGTINGIVHGGGGNDTLLGGVSADYIKGEDGDDYISSGTGGKDHLDGGSGNDIIVVENLGFELVNGGQDQDTLKFSFESDVIDLTNISSSKIQNIEKIDLISTGGNLVLNKESILEMTDENDLLIILGGDNNMVSVSDGSWTQGGDQVVDGETYHTYTSGDATLLVDSDIIPAIS